jgi:hypothetical protein
MKKYIFVIGVFICIVASSKAQKVSFYKGDSDKGHLLSGDSIVYALNDKPCAGFDLSKCLPANGKMYIIEFTYHKWVFTAAIEHVFEVPGDDVVIEIFEDQSEIPEGYDFVSIDSTRYAPEAVVNCKWCTGTYIAVGDKE